MTQISPFFKIGIHQINHCIGGRPDMVKILSSRLLLVLSANMCWNHQTTHCIVRSHLIPAKRPRSRTAHIWQFIDHVSPKAGCRQELRRNGRLVWWSMFAQGIMQLVSCSFQKVQKKVVLDRHLCLFWYFFKLSSNVET